MHKLVVVPYQTVPACRLCEMIVALSISLVNTAAARPYAVLFALSMTSSISLNLIICCTGPNIYSTGKKIIIIYDQGWKWWATKHKLNNNYYYSNQASSNKLLLLLVNVLHSFFVLSPNNLCTHWPSHFAEPNPNSSIIK